MTITSSLRFLYIFGGSGLLCGVGVFKSCVYPSRKWSSNYGNQRTIGLTYLQKAEPAAFLTGILDVLWRHLVCWQRFPFLFGNSKWLQNSDRNSGRKCSWHSLNISSFIFRIASQGPNFVYHTNFFPLSSSFLHAELKFRSKCKTTSFAFVFLVLNIKFLCETLRSFWIWPQEAYTTMQFSNKCDVWKCILLSSL